MTVGEIVVAMDVSQSTVSEHLRRLAETCFVLVEHRGTSSLFRINESCIECFPSAAELVMGTVGTGAMPAPRPGATSRRAQREARRGSAWRKGNEAEQKEKGHDDGNLTPANPDDVREGVRSHYSKSALAVMANGRGRALLRTRRHGDDDTSRKRRRVLRDGRARGFARNSRAGVPRDVATQRPSLSSGKARRCSTSAQAAVSMSSCRPGGWGHRARLTGST